MLRANLREALLGDGFDRFRGVVEPLADEFDLVDIALAAVSLIEGAGARDADEVELFSPPLVAGPPPRAERPGAGSTADAGSAVVPAGARAPATRCAIARLRRARGSASSSVAGGGPGSVPATWSAPSPTRPTSRAASSGRSRSTTASRSSTSRRASPTR